MLDSVHWSGFNLLWIEEELPAIRLRLTRVYIENKSYEDVIACFDRSDTFFYLDPPYYGCENYCGDGIFSRDDFKKLGGILKNLKGKFILSINDHPQTREIFKGFKITKVKTLYAGGAWTGKSAALKLPAQRNSPRKITSTIILVQNRILNAETQRTQRNRFLVWR